MNKSAFNAKKEQLVELLTESLKVAQQMKEWEDERRKELKKPNLHSEDDETFEAFYNTKYEVTMNQANLNSISKALELEIKRLELISMN